MEGWSRCDPLERFVALRLAERTVRVPSDRKRAGPAEPGTPRQHSAGRGWKTYEQHNATAARKIRQAIGSWILLGITSVGVGDLAGLDCKGAVVIRRCRPTAPWPFVRSALLQMRRLPNRRDPGQPRQDGAGQKSVYRDGRHLCLLICDLRGRRRAASGRKGEPWGWYHPCLLMTRARASDAIRV